MGGKETLTSKGLLPEEAWPTQVTKTGSEEVKLHFEKGELIGEGYFEKGKRIGEFENNYKNGER